MPNRYLRVRTIIQAIQYLLEGLRPTNLECIHSLSLAEEGEQSAVTNQQLFVYILRYLQENQDLDLPIYFEDRIENPGSTRIEEAGPSAPTREVFSDTLTELTAEESVTLPETLSESGLYPLEDSEYEHTVEDSSQLAPESSVDSRLQALESLTNTTLIALRQVNRRIAAIGGRVTNLEEQLEGPDTDSNTQV